MYDNALYYTHGRMGPRCVTEKGPMRSLKWALSSWVLLLAWVLFASPASADFFIYLDFDSHQELNYPKTDDCFIDLDVPPFDLSLDPNAPEEILRRVTEDFAPFDVEVTLTEPDKIDEGIDEGIRVTIGGPGSDLTCDGTHVNGTSSIHLANTNTVVAAQFEGTTPRTNKDIAQLASHEVGHMLGFWVSMPLSHYTDIEEHHDLPRKTPILGAPGPTARDVWFKHHNVCRATERDTEMCIWGPQDDIASLAEAVGIRRDDHADWPLFGTRLVQTSTPNSDRRILEGQGIVEINEENWPSTCTPRFEWNDAAVGPAGGILRDAAFVRVARAKLCPARHPFQEFKDFFRFRAVQQRTIRENRVFIRVNTVNEIYGLTGAANLDSDVELWFKEPNAWWRQIPDNLLQTGPNDLNVSISFLLGTGFPNGEYAVAVKSQEGYSDIGYYEITVEGHGVRESTAPLFARGQAGVRENYLGWFLTLMDRIEQLQKGAGATELLTLLAKHGVLDETAATSKAMIALIQGVLTQEDPGGVLAHLYYGEAWNKLTKEDQTVAHKRLGAAIKGLSSQTTGTRQRKESN